MIEPIRFTLHFAEVLRRNDRLVVRKMAEDVDQIALHKRCTHNRDVLLEAKNCGCFYCLKEFPANLITEWIDNSETALCPFCGVDSVLGFDTEPADKALLCQMNDHWFGKSVRMSKEEWETALETNFWPWNLDSPPTRTVS